MPATGNVQASRGHRVAVLLCQRINGTWSESESWKGVDKGGDKVGQKTGQCGQCRHSRQHRQRKVEQCRQRRQLSVCERNQSEKGGRKVETEGGREERRYRDKAGRLDNAASCLTDRADRADSSDSSDSADSADSADIADMCVCRKVGERQKRREGGKDRAAEWTKHVNRQDRADSTDISTLCVCV